MGLYFLAERLGSGDGERKTLLTRQIAFEPLPASVLFALVVDDCLCGELIMGPPVLEPLKSVLHF